MTGLLHIPLIQFIVSYIRILNFWNLFVKDGRIEVGPLAVMQ
jgi:hypothetical protein